MNEQERLDLIDVLGNSSIAFGKYMMPSLFNKKPSLMHYDIDNILHDDTIRKSNIVAPRAHAKSTIISNAHPLCITLTSAMQGRKEYVIIISKTQAVSNELLETIKHNLSHNERIKSLYGDWGEETAKVWRNDRIVLKNDSVIQSRGLGQHLRGIRHHEQRPTLVLVDDGEDENNTKTAEAMRANLRWLLGAVEPSVDPDRGRVIVIGTPQHELCIVETLDKAVGWTSKRFDSIIDEGTDNERALWPEQFTLSELRKKEESMRSMGQLAVFYREWRCQIVGAEEQLFRPEMFRFYAGNLINDGSGQKFLQFTHLHDIEGELYEKGKLNDPIMKPVVTFMGVDPASSLNIDAAYSAIVPIAIDDEMNVYLLPFYRRHATPMTLADAIVSYYKKYTPEITNVEAVGYQEMLRDYLRTRIDTFIPGLNKKILPRDPKSARLESLEPWFAQRKVYMMPGMGALKNELLLYPRGKTKDLMDGLHLALSRIFAPTTNYHIEQQTTKRERQQLRDMEKMGQVAASWKTA